MSIKRLLHSGSGLVLIALAFVAFNMLAGLLLRDVRLDLTAQRLYSLSDGSRQILTTLNEPVDLYFFYSDRASREQPQWRQQAQQVGELLESFERASGGRLRLHRVDPQPFSEDEDRAARFGLQPLPLGTGDPLYFGLAGVNGLDQQQVIPFFTPGQEGLLEYRIARLVQALARPQKPVVGLLSSIALDGSFDAETGQAQPSLRVLEDIRQQFELRMLEPAIGHVPDEVQVLLLVQPVGLSEPTLYAIDQFVLRGGRVLALLDPLAEAAGGSQAALQPLLAAWGVQMPPAEAVIDGSYAQQIAGPDGTPLPHVGWLKLPAAAMAHEDVVTGALEQLNLASAGELQPLPGASTHFQPLLTSSTYAMRVPALRLQGEGAPSALLRDLEPDGQSHVLAARISGPAHTAFPQGIEGQKHGLQQAASINLILLADSDLLGDGLWAQVQESPLGTQVVPFADNATFIINALDNLAGSDALIAVRSRGQLDRPFLRIQALQQQAAARLRAREAELDQRLRVTEQQLAELQQGGHPLRPGDVAPEQQRAIQQFLQEKLELRRELRDIRWQLQAEVDSLQARLKFFAIAGMPLLLALAAALAWLWRRR